MAEQATQLEFVHTSQFTTPVAEEYARELLEFAGENFRGGAVYFTCGGSESVETALKLARQYQVEVGQTSRYQVLSRTQSYHGSTLGALSVSGNKRRREIYLPMVREFAHVGIPYCYRCHYDCTDGCRNCGLEYAAELEKGDRGRKRRSRGFYLRTGQRGHAGRGGSAARISAKDRRSLPAPWHPADCRRSHDRHGPHRTKLRQSNTGTLRPTS